MRRLGSTRLLLLLKLAVWNYDWIVGDETDNSFKRHDQMCAARPLSDHDIEREGQRLADSMNEEPK